MKYLVPCSALLLAGLVAVAADNDQPQPKTDADFFIQAVSANQRKVRLSESAEKNASDPKVKEFAARMVKEHTQLADALAKQAEGLKVVVAAGQEKETRDALDRLGKLTGPEFDRAYLTEMVAGHEGSQKMFEGYSKTTTNTGLKTFTADVAASEKKHLEEARKLLDGLK